MKTTQTLQFSIVPPAIRFSLDIVEFDPATVFGQGWKFAPGINGPADNNGISAFQTAIVKASALLEDEGRKLLFPTGLIGDQSVITGEEKIKVLTGQPLADPDLLWSLVNEDGQKILHYLYDTYGVTYMEALRRVLLGPDGDPYSLCLRRRDAGSWYCYYYRLVRNRNVDSPALSLAVELVS